MSEINDKIPTNEEIIADITNNLEAQCINNDNSNIVNEIPSDFEKSDEEGDKKKAEIIPDDYIDEDSLKNLETTLNEEEKLERRKQAFNLKNKGNDEFKADEFYQSIQTYTEALKLCPVSFESDRSILYSNRAASKSKTNNLLSAVDDCSKAVELDPKYVRAYLRRAKLYKELNKLDECLADYKKVLEIDPGIAEARAAVVHLPPLIEERNEKMKAEMLGK